MKHILRKKKVFRQLLRKKAWQLYRYAPEVDSITGKSKGGLRLLFWHFHFINDSQYIAAAVCELTTTDNKGVYYIFKGDLITTSFGIVRSIANNENWRSNDLTNTKPGFIIKDTVLKSFTQVPRRISYKNNVVFEMDENEHYYLTYERQMAADEITKMLKKNIICISKNN